MTYIGTGGAMRSKRAANVAGLGLITQGVLDIDDQTTIAAAQKQAQATGRTVSITLTDNSTRLVFPDGTVSGGTTTNRGTIPGDPSTGIVAPPGSLSPPGSSSTGLLVLGAALLGLALLGSRA